MQFDAIGTHWLIEATIPLDQRLQHDIHKTIDAFDHIYSRFRKDSAISKLGRFGGTCVLPSSSVELFRFYDELYDATDGAVTPLVGQVLDDMGYDADYSFIPKEHKKDSNWKTTIHRNEHSITVSEPVIVDIGAIGKGYLVDTIGQLLERNNIEEYVIDASGDIRHRGKTIQVIGLEHPNDPTLVIGTVPLKNKSLCASATNRRRWGEGLHHVIDGRTSMPTENVKATWVIADSTMRADGLSTALFFADQKQLAAIGSFQYVRMFHDNTIEYSSNFVGELFT